MNGHTIPPFRVLVCDNPVCEHYGAEHTDYAATALGPYAGWLIPRCACGYEPRAIAWNFGGVAAPEAAP